VALPVQVRLGAPPFLKIIMNIKEIYEFWKLLKQEEDFDKFIENSKVLIYALENNTDLAMPVNDFFKGSC
jgi:hypothetical protein